MTSRHGSMIRLLTTSAAVTALAVGAAPAALAAPGDWTQVSQVTTAAAFPRISNTAEPTVARFDSSVQIVWPQSMSSSSASYLSGILDGAGTLTAGPFEAIPNWSTLIGNPTLVSSGGQRLLAFSGLAPGRSGAEYYATSGDGLSWAVSPGSLSATQSAYAGYGSDLVDNAGTPVWVGNAGTSRGITWHVGTSPTNPAPAGSDQSYLLGGCCAYGAAAARDEATGAVYAAFYSNSSATTENGIQVGQILPTQGAFAQAPESTTVRDGAPSSVSPSQRVAMTGRPGGGVYVAYVLGYPTTRGIRVLNVTTGATMDVPGSAGARSVSMTSGPDGRLWVLWTRSDALLTVHTNAAATVFGAVGAWGAPPGTSTMWKTAGDGSAGGLDAVVTATTSSAINVWHRQVMRTLTVKANRSSVRHGRKVKFTVTDAGDPVAGVSVRFGGHARTTNAAGRVTLRASRSTGQSRATATKAGYNPGVTSVRVR